MRGKRREFKSMSPTPGVRTRSGDVVKPVFPSCCSSKRFRLQSSTSGPWTIAMAFGYGPAFLRRPGAEDSAS